MDVPDFLKAAETAVAPKSVADTLAKVPLNDPIGVLTALKINVS
jgi:hypothetical protein